MGDTFPSSFACLDLRVRSPDALSTAIQELGRLCRYPIACSSPAEQLPAEDAWPDLFRDEKVVAVKWEPQQDDPKDAGIGRVRWSEVASIQLRS